MSFRVVGGDCFYVFLEIFILVFGFKCFYLGVVLLR